MLTRYTYVYLSDILNQMYLKQTYLNLLNMYSWILKSPAASSRFSAKTIIHYILKMLIGYRYRYICIRFAWISSCPCCNWNWNSYFMLISCAQRQHGSGTKSKFLHKTGQTLDLSSAVCTGTHAHKL